MLRKVSVVILLGLIAGNALANASNTLMGQYEVINQTSYYLEVDATENGCKWPDQSSGGEKIAPGKSLICTTSSFPVPLSGPYLHNGGSFKWTFPNRKDPKTGRVIKGRNNGTIFAFITSDSKPLSVTYSTMWTGIQPNGSKRYWGMYCNAIGDQFPPWVLIDSQMGESGLPTFKCIFKFVKKQ